MGMQFKEPLEASGMLLERPEALKAEFHPQKAMVLNRVAGYDTISMCE